MKVFCLFERRKSAVHKWNLMHDYENNVPDNYNEICRFSFDITQWRENANDEVAMYLLVNLLSLDKSIDKNLLFFRYVEEFIAQRPGLYYLRNCTSAATNLSKKTQSLIQELTEKENIVSRVCLTLQELYEFFNDLEEQPEAKQKHRLLRFLFSHMQVKLCTLNYPEVRVHLVTTWDKTESHSQIETIDFHTKEELAAQNDESTDYKQEIAKIETDNVVVNDFSLHHIAEQVNNLSQVKQIELEQEKKEETPNQCKEDSDFCDRKSLTTTDTYDFSGAGWDIEKIDFSVVDKDLEIYFPLPSVEDLFPVDENSPLENLPVVEKTNGQECLPPTPTTETKASIKVVNILQTEPKTFSLPMKNVLLAISEIKEETRSITNWIHQKLSNIYAERKTSLCFISQNFSEAECASVRQFVAEKKQNDQLVTIGVECEFSPLDPASRECTTLLNEFDALTSLLILDMIEMSNVTMIFETTKPFNHVWCWKYNLINTQSSHWFSKTSQTGDYANFLSQKQAHSAAMIRLVMSASTQAAALVRCTNLSATKKETYFDMVILGCNANCNETQQLFNFVNDQCVTQKLDSARWKKRISNLNIGDALAIPISVRNNDYQYDLFYQLETEKQIAIAGASSAMLNQKTTFRAPLTNIPFMQSIPKPSSYAFLSNGIKVDYQFGDPFILKNVNQNE